MTAERIAELESLIRVKRADNASLNARYGTGVRPSWVSTDEGMNWAAIEWAEKEIATLKGGA